MPNLKEYTKGFPKGGETYRNLNQLLHLISVALK